MAVKTPIQYKGFTINYIQGEYRADAYANPQFSNANLAKLKKEIRDYLKSESNKVSTYAEGGEITVNVYEDSFPFANSKEKNAEFSSLDKAKEWAISEIKKQRNYRSNSGKLWATFTVDGNEIFEERIKESATTYAEGGEVRKPRLKKGDSVYIYGKTWFQKSYGNTYHITKVYVNDKVIGISEQEYGYGEQYVQTGMQILWENYLPPYSFKTSMSYWRLKDFGIKIQTEQTEVSRERDLHHTSYAEGGSLKGHGLAIGDEIMNLGEFGNMYVLNRGVVYMVDLSSGKRTMTKMSKDDAISTFKDGGEVKDDPQVVRYYFEDDEYEYAKGGGLSKGRYHILAEIKGKQPVLYASTNNKSEITSLMAKAKKDLKELSGKNHYIFVTDSVEDRRIYNFENGGEIDINDIDIPVHYTMFEDEMYEYGQGGKMKK